METVAPAMASAMKIFAMNVYAFFALYTVKGTRFARVFTRELPRHDAPQPAVF